MTRPTTPSRRDLICRELFTAKDWLSEAEILRRIQSAGDTTATDRAVRNHLASMKHEVEIENPGAATGMGRWRVRE